MKTFNVKLVRIRIKDDWTPIITMHAWLRYIERVKGVDIDAAKREMVTTNLRRAIALGAGSVKLGSGARIIIENGRVVTVLSPSMRRKGISKEADKKANQVVSRSHPLDVLDPFGNVVRLGPINKASHA